MESLHLSFSKVTNAGLFSGIPIDISLTFYHLFFADDVIFIGKWDSLNILTIINVLKCFHLASGLKINFHKSKLMGISTRPKEVDTAATTMGCFIFITPFVHLGVKVGGAMSRIKYWDGVVWSLETTGEFFVKSVRQFIDDSILPKEEVATRRVKVMPIKINLFAWRVRLDKLPTRLNLSLKGIDISTIVCPLCHASIESGLLFLSNGSSFMDESYALVGARGH
ncbi:hypothetical protein Tco_1392790 [Tanacetum coccineum]